MKTLISLFLVLILSACSNTNGMVTATEEANTDDKVVTMYPVTTDCDIKVCTQIGAQWSKATPNEVMLIIKMAEPHFEIKGAYLNLDGNLIFLSKPSMQSNHTAKAGTISPQAAYTAFRTSVDVLKSAVNSKRAWLRVTTQSAYFDDRIKDVSTDSDALNALILFLGKIDS
ncbi:MAG: hypothetical protein CBC55_04620 [Gammaproteobacteria bacterium TMED95]|nr:MAG: hypothetical protein CBC55_04620 [Gammaproteobacteria bacterium TMED95]